MGDWELRRNRNRGFRDLVVWQDAIQLVRLVCDLSHCFSYELKRLLAQQIACADSIHRNIAEGWCRRSVGEYLYFLNVALGSAGEFVSGVEAFRTARILNDEQCETLDAHIYKIENHLLKLVESLRATSANQRETTQSLVRETREEYIEEAHEMLLAVPIPQSPTPPIPVSP
jgi:four helix bundle protein